MFGLRKKGIFTSLLLGLGLLLAGCVTIQVQNNSQNPAWVMVRLPDQSRGVMRLVHPGEVAEFSSSHGGQYQVGIIPEESYRLALQGLRDEIRQGLFQGEMSLNTAEVRTLVQHVRQLDTQLINLSFDAVSCGGYAGEYETHIIDLTYDGVGGDFKLDCP